MSSGYRYWLCCQPFVHTRPLRLTDTKWFEDSSLRIMLLSPAGDLQLLRRTGRCFSDEKIVTAVVVILRSLWLLVRLVSGVKSTACAPDNIKEAVSKHNSCAGLHTLQEEADLKMLARYSL